MKTTVTLLIFLTLFALNTFAQDSPQWHLPDGAKARLGKGWISEIEYSPDGSRSPVVSVFGSTIRRPVKRSPCSRGIRVRSTAWRSARMEAPSLVRVSTLPSGCGMRSPARTKTHSQGIRVGSKAWRSARMEAPSLVGVATALCSCGMHRRTSPQGIRVGSAGC